MRLRCMPTSSALGVEVKTLYNTFNTQCKIETKSEHKKNRKTIMTVSFLKRNILNHKIKFT